MRRAVTTMAVALALAACAGGSSALAGGEASSSAAPPPKQGCTWKRHAKVVFKRVRRRGEVRRVRRVKRWWTCERQPAAGAPGGQAGTPSPSGGSEQPEPTIGRLGVKAVEWSYTLSRPEVSAGEVIVELQNQGEDGHNLKLERNGSSEAPLSVNEAGPGQRTTGRFTLSPGTYHLYCSLLEHEDKGMAATLTVGG